MVDFLGVKPVRLRGKPGDVGEEYCHMFALALDLRAGGEDLLSQVGRGVLLR